MEKKARFTVIVKILGVCAILFSLVGFYVLVEYSENISLALWNTVYMVFIPMGGIFNLLDFGKVSYSKAACLSYTLAIILRTFFDITIAEEMHWDFLLMLSVALAISVLRYLLIQKVEQSKKVNTSSVNMKNDQQTYILNSSQPKCRVGIMREARVGGGASAFTVYVDGIKTTTIKNGKTTRLILAPGRHVIGFGTIGSKIEKSIVLDLMPDSDANIMCHTTLSGIEAALTPVDVCSLSVPVSTDKAQQGVDGCLAWVIGIILLIIGLFILGVKLKFFVFFIPIK